MQHSILIIQQTEHGPPGLIEDAIREQGWACDILMAQEALIPQALMRHSGLVVMGGHMSANDSHLPFIARQINLMKWCVKWDFPTLGIGLGAQMLARAAGGSIEPAPVRELGWHILNPTFMVHDDPLFGELLPTGFHVFQWHGETFTRPEKATLLATCPEVVNQAFRLADGRQYGLQFHAEATEPMIRQWVRHSTSESAYLGEHRVAALLADIARYLPIASKHCRRIADAWLKLL